MSVPLTVGDVLRDHVTLCVECIDRMYLNVYQPGLQHDLGVVGFFHYHRGYSYTSSALMAPMSRAFVDAIERFVERHRLPLISFEKRQRKDDVMAEHLAEFRGQEGVLFVGKAQEKAGVFRTQRRWDQGGRPYPWIVRSTAMVNHYYFYCVDRDFGPFFLKFCSYFPYTAKLCINGHEYAKRQLARRGIRYEALDNGILSCADPRRLQGICDDLSAERIDAFLRKWLRKLPHPFARDDLAAGYRYDVSILQAEFSLTQVLDRPVTGRIFFEDVIRENLDIGRPDQVQLIFDRRLIGGHHRPTPGRFRTRVITDGVVPSLHLDYKHTRVKQYHKEGRALRTETTINDTRDFGICKGLKNLPALREVGFRANRRLLDVQRISHDCSLGEQEFEHIQRPVRVHHQRAAGLRYGDRRVQALFHALLLFRLHLVGFTNRELREALAPLLGISADDLTQGRMTYDLRRLRLHGFIKRIPKSHRYAVTPEGFRSALFYARTYDRILRTGLSALPPAGAPGPLRSAIRQVEDAIDAWCDKAQLAA